MDENGPRINLRLVSRTPLIRKAVRFWSSLAEEARQYATEAIVAYSVSAYIVHFLKEHVTEQQSGRLLRCPILAEKVDLEKRRFPLP